MAIDRQPGEAEDGGEEVVEVVRDAAGKPADGFHLLRLLQLALDRLADLALFTGLPPQFGVAELTIDRSGQAREIVLEHVVVRAGPHRRDRCLLADGAGDDDERIVQLAGLDGRERVHRAESWHRMVADDRVPGRVVERGLEALPCLDAEMIHRVARALQMPHDQGGIVFGVFDEQQPQRAA